MAKLQGHLLKYKGKPEEAIENAKDLLDIDFQIKDMTINEWLRRLNLHSYAHKFTTVGGLFRVADLKSVEEKEIKENLGVEALTHTKRIMEMAKGNEEIKALFNMQSKS